MNPSKLPPGAPIVLTTQRRMTNSYALVYQLAERYSLLPAVALQPSKNLDTYSMLQVTGDVQLTLACSFTFGSTHAALNFRRSHHKVREAQAALQQFLNGYSSAISSANHGPLETFQQKMGTLKSYNRSLPRRQERHLMNCRTLRKAAFHVGSSLVSHLIKLLTTGHYPKGLSRPDEIK